MPVWLATASFDRGFELAPNNLLPTHQIAPDIDAEREFTLESLEGTSQVTGVAAVQLVPAGSGHNFAGDPFFYDGQAYITALGPGPLP